MDLEIKDHVIIVTGGSKGIGRGIAEGIAREGGIPVIAGRSPEEGTGLVEELKDQGGEAFFIEVKQLGNPEDCREVVEQTLARYNRIDGVVNNAGINDGVGLEDGSPEEFRHSIFRNLEHYYYMVHFALDALKKSEGAIVNISSKTAVTGQGNTSGYAASKGAQLALTREWAVELLKYNIRVNAILPAEVMTPLYKNWLQSFDDPEQKQKEITEQIPLGKRMTTTEEIADMAVFLLSKRSSHTTGQLLFVDGGYVHLDRVATVLQN